MIRNKTEIGAFCETYGDTINNRVLEYVLTNLYSDFAIGDMAKELEISKPKAYEVMKLFESKEYVHKSRIVGKTQLYKLNRENERVKLFLKDFAECLRIVAEQYFKKHPEIEQPIVAEKSINKLGSKKKKGKKH